MKRIECEDVGDVRGKKERKISQFPHVEQPERKESEPSERVEKRGGRTTNRIVLSHSADMSLSLEIRSIATNLSRRSQAVGLTLPIVVPSHLLSVLLSAFPTQNAFLAFLLLFIPLLLKQKKPCSAHSQQRSQHLCVLLPPPPACAHSTPMPPSEIRCLVRGTTDLLEQLFIQLRPHGYGDHLHCQRYSRRIEEDDD